VSLIISILDTADGRRHRLRNLLHSVLLLGSMVGLLTFCAWLLFGIEIALWALLGWAVALVVGPRVSPQFLLRLYRARHVPPEHFPQGYEILRELTARAALPKIPALYLVPSSAMNAFTMGRRDEAVVAITDGLLRAVTLRELAGVLAHEISHIRNNDLWIMNLADGISRLTGLLSVLSVWVLIFGFFQLGTGAGPALILLAVVLMFAPSLSGLLQLALSRAREFDADLVAADLTGDPEGLAFALLKLEQHQGGMWERLVWPGRRNPDPSILRSHPTTQDRVERLLGLKKEEGRAAPQGSFGRQDTSVTMPQRFPAVTQRPRRRASGLWY